MSALKEIIAKFGFEVDDSQLKKGVGALQDMLGGLGKLGSMLGASATLGALLEFTKASTEQVNALAKQSRFLRTSEEDLQRWQQAAQIAGVSSEAINGALETMATRAKKPTDALMQVADKLAAIKDPTQRARMGTMMLGNSYRDLEPLLEKGSKGIRGLMSDADELAGVFGKDQVAAAKAARVEMGKLEVFYGGLRTQLASTVIPIFAALLNRYVVPAAIHFRKLTKNTQIFKAATIALTMSGVFKLISAFGGLGKMLGLLTRQFLRVVAPILILEDFLVFLSGGKSAFGDVLDKAFGKGTADRVRAAVLSMKTAFLEFIEEVKYRPKEAVERLISWFKSIGLVSEWWEGFAETFVGTFHTVFDAFTGGWDGALAFLKNVGEGMLLIIKIAVVEMNHAFTWLGAQVMDVFTGIWNGIISGFQSAMKLMSGAAKALNMDGTVKMLAEVTKSAEGGKVASGSEMRSAMYDKERMGLASQFDVISAKFAAQRPQVNVNTAAPVLNITVPPTTPEQQVNRIAAATSKALQKSNAQAYTAMVKGRS